MADEPCDRAELERTWAIDEWESISPDLVAQGFDAVPSGLSITAKRQQWIGLAAVHNPPTPWVHSAGECAGKEAVGGVLAPSEYNIQSDYFEEAGVVVDEEGCEGIPTKQAGM